MISHRLANGSLANLFRLSHGSLAASHGSLTARQRLSHGSLTPLQRLYNGSITALCLYRLSLTAPAVEGEEGRGAHAAEAGAAAEADDLVPSESR